MRTSGKMEFKSSENPILPGSDTDDSDASAIESSTFMTKLRELHQRDVASGYGSRALGVTWNHLTVEALSAEAAINENVISQFNLSAQLRKRGHQRPVQTILHESHGCVKPGEMLLVLGRPGSGCTTLLNLLSNRRAGYTKITGDVHFGGMDHAEALQYRSQIVMNTEEETFFPSLTVKQTMDFATKLKIPAHLPQDTDPRRYAAEMENFLLQALGVSHAANTRVGNEYVRGVSGGERKRVSVLECLASRASVFCWDNSTRGLDASNALVWAQLLRAMTNAYGVTTIVTLYQAGNDIFNLFDKVLVLDGGRQIYYGPAQQAKDFMEGLGFICPRGANVADFLTGVTVPTERQIRAGFEGSFPRDAESIEQRYRETLFYKTATADYAYPSSDEARLRTADFRSTVALERHSASSATTANIFTQIRIATVRNYQILAGDKATFAMKQGSTIVQALIAGSLYYNAPDGSSGLFLKAGALNWSVLYQSLTAMSEVVDTFTGRPVHLKHRAFAFNHPISICLAQTFLDLPMNLLQVTLWSFPVYFMTGLDSSAAGFFTYWLILLITTLCCNALFRAVGACFRTFDGAAKYAGYVIAVMAMYTGYQIPKTDMHPWFAWFYWLNPLSYGFESLMVNEFHGKNIDCVGINLIPHGTAYSNSKFQSCAGVRGAQPGFTYVTGDDYLAALSYDFTHLWRNFGILCGWYLLYVAITALAMMGWRDNGSSAGHTLIPRELVKQHPAKPHDVESRPVNEKKGGLNLPGAKDVCEPPSGGRLEQSNSIFTWQNLCYTVDTKAGPQVLLDQVEGWVKPGTLTALMGSSGAGKTTLLDVLAQRKVDGYIQGSILVDGHPTPLSFQRSTGYCEQLDVHEPYATVREALEFSALLRQPHSISPAEKLKYVQVVIDLLELHDISETLIGAPGSDFGLSIEQRKRVTIGVELVSKPKFLIFLDEPTSGLDGQAAYNIVRFLRRLADSGQAVLVTVHQPSAQLFTQFDRLLLLTRGGKTVYFGNIGHDAETVTNYFAKYGAPCPAGANPATHIIDVASGHLSDTDWHQVWLDSPDHADVVRELREISRPGPPRCAEMTVDDEEFATPLLFQVKVVLRRMNKSLYRNTPYINNKVLLHIGLALFNGFTYWQIGDTVQDIQMRLFTVFVWMFVAPGTVNQLQPLFIQTRDIYDAREKKSRIYSWKALVTSLILSEVPYLCVCGVLYFVCWYWTVGFTNDPQHAGATFFMVLIYEFLYTGIGQCIAAYAPNAVFAALLNPLLVGTMVSFCGILVPYDQIVAFWRYWVYYLNPVTYLVGSVLTFTIADVDVKCSDAEFAIFDPPSDVTCGQYLASYLESSGANLANPNATSSCRVCQYTTGGDYLQTIKLQDYNHGWIYASIVILFILSSYSLVYIMMKMRTKTSKKSVSS